MSAAFFGGLGGGLAGIAGAGLSAILSDKQAKKQRAWAEKMSSTSYQRGMKDMRLAGLNPILAYKQGGASSPTGSMAPMPNFGAAISGGITSGVAAARGGSQITLANAAAAETSARTETERFKQTNLEAQAVYAAAHTELAKAQSTQSQASAEGQFLQNQMTQLQMPKAKALAALQKTWWGQKLIQGGEIGRNIAPLLTPAAILGIGRGRLRNAGIINPRKVKGRARIFDDYRLNDYRNRPGGKRK